MEKESLVPFSVVKKGDARSWASLVSHQSGKGLLGLKLVIELDTVVTVAKSVFSVQLAK